MGVVGPVSGVLGVYFSRLVVSIKACVVVPPAIASVWGASVPTATVVVMCLCVVCVCVLCLVSLTLLYIPHAHIGI